MPAIRRADVPEGRMPRYPLCTGKHKRGCTGSNGVPPSVAPSKRRFGAAPTARYIHRRRKRCVGRCNRRPAVRAVLPTAVARRPSPALYTLRNRFPAQTRPSLYARAQRQAARRHCKVNEGFCASRKLFRPLCRPACRRVAALQRFPCAFFNRRAPNQVIYRRS